MSPSTADSASPSLSSREVGRYIMTDLTPHVRLSFSGRSMTLDLFVFRFIDVRVCRG